MATNEDKDKYQQMLYENNDDTTCIYFERQDKYQQMLYENRTTKRTFNTINKININRCCTKTQELPLNNHKHLQININRCCTKTALMIFQSMIIYIDKYQQILYENVSLSALFKSKAIDKYQQILYENILLACQTVRALAR